jgi:hypothetical protein
MKSSYYKPFEEDLLRPKLSGLDFFSVAIFKIKNSFPAPKNAFPNP